MSLSATMLY